MYVVADSLDDLLAKVYRQILTRGTYIDPSKGPALEINGALLNLSAPRVRLSRTESRGILFSALGELLWVLAGSKALNFIEHYISGYGQYSDDGKSIFGAYGPRIFGKRPNNQIPRVITMLKAKQDTRQAVIQLFDRTDTLQNHLDIPCTCTMQFLIRGNRLHMLTSMRSNDAWKGLPHDVFVFTMLQELVARSLGIELGHYKHSVGSLHLYKEDDTWKKAIRYLDEGVQPRKPMPPMPHGDPWEAVKRLGSYEKAVREGVQSVADPSESMEPYWADLATLLAIHAAFKTPNNQNEIRRLKRHLNADVYSMYINKRNGAVLSEKDQLSIFNGNTGITKGNQ